MALRTIRYGNDDILRKKCKEVAEVDDRIRMYLDDMLDTLLKLVNPVIIESVSYTHLDVYKRQGVM